MYVRTHVLYNLQSFYKSVNYVQTYCTSSMTLDNQMKDHRICQNDKQEPDSLLDKMPLCIANVDSVNFEVLQPDLAIVQTTAQHGQSWIPMQCGYKFCRL